VNGQFHAPVHLPLGKELPVPIGKEVGWTPESVWTTWRRENSWSSRNRNSDPSIVQPLPSRYTDCAVPAVALLWTTRTEHQDEVRNVGAHSEFHETRSVMVALNLGMDGRPDVLWLRIGATLLRKRVLQNKRLVSVTMERNNHSTVHGNAWPSPP
jgi:hypothetical protein